VCLYQWSHCLVRERFFGPVTSHRWLVRRCEQRSQWTMTVTVYVIPWERLVEMAHYSSVTRHKPLEFEEKKLCRFHASQCILKSWTIFSSTRPAGRDPWNYLVIPWWSCKKRREDKLKWNQKKKKLFNSSQWNEAVRWCVGLGIQVWRSVLNQKPIRRVANKLSQGTVGEALNSPYPRIHPHFHHHQAGPMVSEHRTNYSKRQSPRNEISDRDF
jgi:hypothetical protein